MPQHEFKDILVVTELRGSYPDVPFFPDVDIAELTKGDDDPLYLTIPIGKANVVSGNMRFYDEAWLQELERQVIANRPIGIMGHLSEEELSTKFPEEAVFWLGVRRIGELLWAKGYIPKASAARDRIRRYKSANKSLATSIFATAEGIWNKARGAMDMMAETLKLQQIDIVPADRAGIPDLAAVPWLTAEMSAAGTETEQEREMTKDELLSELRAAKVTPQQGWQPVSATPVSEMAAQLADRDDRITVLETTVQEFRRREFVRAVDEKVAELTDWTVSEAVDAGGKSGKDKLAALRAMFKRAILEKMGAEQNVESVTEMATAAWEEIKPIAEMMRDALAGPSAIVHARVRETNGVKPVEDTQENRQKALDQMGIAV